MSVITKKIRERNRLDGRMTELESIVHNERLEQAVRDKARYDWVEAANRFNQLQREIKRISP